MDISCQHAKQDVIGFVIGRIFKMFALRRILLSQMSDIFSISHFVELEKKALSFRRFQYIETERKRNRKNMLC